MENHAVPTIAVAQPARSTEWIKQAALVVGASWFVAACAHITVPLPFTPVPLTLQNWGVLVVGLALGSRRGFAALMLYLAEGAFGLPVFNPTGPGGLLQLLGPTGGYLMVYPMVAAVAGLVMERGAATFARAAIAGLLGEIVLFAGGLGWLFVLTHSFSTTILYGLYAFIFGEIIKVMLAAAVGSRMRRTSKVQS